MHEGFRSCVETFQPYKNNDTPKVTALRKHWTSVGVKPIVTAPVTIGIQRYPVDISIIFLNRYGTGFRSSSLTLDQIKCKRKEDRFAL